MKKFHIDKAFWIIGSAVILLAALLALLDKSGHLLQGWLAYAILLALGAASIFGVRKAVGATRQATTIALLALILRLGIGVALTLLLPVFGYKDSQEHQAGYVYTDAYLRDNQAYSLAVSGQPILNAFTGRLTGDQYGGMLAISAFIYRFLSPDAHRPFLILILGAVAAAWGVLCLWKASNSWFGEKTALLAAWLFALYPESILLGSSQMREAIVIPLTALTFYGVTAITDHQRQGWFWLLLSAVILFPIQPLVSIISLAVLFGVWVFDPATLPVLRNKRTIFAIFPIASLLLIVLLVVSSILVKLPSLAGSGPLSVYLSWFQNNFTFQSYLLEKSSGILQSLMTSVGEKWHWMIILVYGIAQPVLPATVGDPGAAWIARIIGFFRAAGWYMLVLFLIYGALGLLRNRQEPRRLQLLWISLVNWAWIMMAALNAGADQWDNPRYRTILLLWQVILVAWAWQWARSRRDAWLWRWLAVEVVFVGLFTEWYLGRYYPGFLHLDIKLMILISLIISAFILTGGFIWDRRKIRLTSPDSRL